MSTRECKALYILINFFVNLSEFLPFKNDLEYFRRVTAQMVILGDIWSSLVSENFLVLL